MHFFRSYRAINRSMLYTSCAVKKNSSRQNKGELRISANEAIPQYDTSDLRDTKIASVDMRLLSIPIVDLLYRYSYCRHRNTRPSGTPTALSVSDPLHPVPGGERGI